MNTRKTPYDASSLKLTTGATWRKARLMVMVRFIQDKIGASTEQLQSLMMAREGLKFRTTSEYLQELHMGGYIELQDDGLWHTTDKIVEFFR